ncbi:MAG: NUDIX domain-containing protein [Actinobacteria bacterium]|nr:NUDIX domain-containing protein [Actinomycetota bacterium]MBV9255145.1 NUDIX domain-containing protein [Actinomycetota bacterium]
MRGLLKAMVGSLTPVDDREARSQAEFLAALDRLDRPCDEHADPTHVTASAIVTGSRGVVLHRHKRMGIWLQPGGHIEPGETPEDAALREVYEETGLALGHPADGPRLVHVDVHAAPKGHTHLDLRFLLEAGDADPSPPAHESQDVRWFSWDEAIAVADPGMSGILRSLYRSH